MNADQLQARIYSGYAKAALRIGSLHALYRPTGLSDPLDGAPAWLRASFNAEDMKYSRPDKYGTPTRYGLFDGSLTQPGDYLVGPAGTFFIAAQQAHLPILCVECNRRVRVIRNGTPAADAVGDVGYSGQCADSSIDVIGQAGDDGAFGYGWPASILLKGRSEQTGSGIPSATKNVGWQILLPPSVTPVLCAGDLVLDDIGRRYAIHGAEQTDLGWRIQAVEEHA